MFRGLLSSKVEAREDRGLLPVRAQKRDEEIGCFLVGGFYKSGRVFAGVDLSEDKGEGESTHHGVWPLLGR